VDWVQRRQAVGEQLWTVMTTTPITRPCSMEFAHHPELASAVGRTTNEQAYMQLQPHCAGRDSRLAALVCWGRKTGAPPQLSMDCLHEHEHALTDTFYYLFAGACQCLPPRHMCRSRIETDLRSL
jgi:hypothetical protein